MEETTTPQHKFADTVEFTDSGVFIDGDFFPFYVGERITVKPQKELGETEQLFGVTVTILAKSVLGDPELEERKRREKAQADFDEANRIAKEKTGLKKVWEV